MLTTLLLVLASNIVVAYVAFLFGRVAEEEDNERRAAGIHAERDPS